MEHRERYDNRPVPGQRVPAGWFLEQLHAWQHRAGLSDGATVGELRREVERLGREVGL